MFPHQSASLCAIIALSLVIIVVARSSSLEESNKQLEDRMKSSFQDYNWFQEKSDATVNEQTSIWDAVQSGLSCCGLKEANDWDQYRPKDVDQDKYPATCCFQYTPGEPASKKLCSKSYNGIYKSGCLDNIKDEEGFYQAAYNWLIFGLTILGSIFFIMSIAVGATRTSSSLTIR